MLKLIARSTHQLRTNKRLNGGCSKLYSQNARRIFQWQEENKSPQECLVYCFRERLRFLVSCRYLVGGRSVGPKIQLI